jgi:hypothetical protein
MTDQSNISSHGTDGTPGRAWQGRFLAALRNTGVVRHACQAARVGRSTVYRERVRNEQFAIEWSDALEDGIDELEAEARRRAKNGSDALLQFLLKAHRPGVYRDSHRVEHSGTLRRETVLDLSRLSGEELDDLERLVTHATANS